jgi:hypothetical protein
MERIGRHYQGHHWFCGLGRALGGCDENGGCCFGRSPGLVLVRLFVDSSDCSYWRACHFLENL